MGHNADNAIRNRLTQALRGVLPEALLAAGVIPFTLFNGPIDDVDLHDWVLRHAVQYGLDAFWILTGRGEPSEIDRTVPRAAPVFAMLPIDPQSGHWRPLIVESVALDPSILSRDRFVVRMEDRTMEPRIRQGAYMVVDTTEKTIPNEHTRPQKVFAVDMPGEGLLARLAAQNPEAERVELRCQTNDYPPLFIPETRIADRVVGRIVWVAQSL